MKKKKGNIHSILSNKMIQAFFARSYNPRAHKIRNKGKTVFCGWKCKEKNYILTFSVKELFTNVAYSKSHKMRMFILNTAFFKVQ